MTATVVDSGRIGLAKYFIDQWGGNPSTVTYGQALTSYQVGGQWWQYAAWYGVDNYVRAARRTPAGVWETITLPITLNYDDAHNALAWGISHGDGRLHLVAGQHAQPQFYTATAPGVLDNTPPWTASLFGPVTSTMLGTTVGSNVTLPTFTSKPGGGLLYWYRIGASGNGTLRLAEYEAGVWTVLGDVTSSSGSWAGPGGTSTTRNLYWAPPLYTPDGRLHLCGTWREGNPASFVPATAPMPNHHIVYAYSEDHGRTWRNNVGTLVATTGTDPIGVNDTGIHVPGITATKNAIQCYDMAVGPGGLIGFLPDYVDGALMTAANGFSQPGYVATLAERDKWASEHPRWRVPPASGWAGGTWPAVSIKIGGTHLFSNWPEGRHTCTRGKMAFTPSGDMVVIHSGLMVCSARASTGYTDWTLDVPSGAGFGDLQIDRSREAEGVVSVLTLEQARPGATASAVLVRDILLDA